MESKMIDLKSIIGIFSLTNTGSILVHAIDYGEDRVLASLNGDNPIWCPIVDEYWECSGELETGFTYGNLFCPFCEIMRI